MDTRTAGQTELIAYFQYYVTLMDQKIRWANAEMHNIHHMYKTSLQSSYLQDQPTHKSMQLTISHHKSQGNFMPYNNRVIAQVLAFL